MNNLPGSDPDYPPYGWGNGGSAAASGTAAFEVAPESQVAVMTGDEYTRRERRANRQELGFDAAYETGFDGIDLGSVAAAEIAPALAGAPSRGPAVTPSDDANTAAPTITQ